MNAEEIQMDGQKAEIVICSGCGGAGRIELNPNRLSSDDMETGECSKCGGQGRLRKHTVTKYRKFNFQ